MRSNSFTLSHAKATHDKHVLTFMHFDPRRRNHIKSDVDVSHRLRSCSSPLSLSRREGDWQATMTHNGIDGRAVVMAIE